MFKKNKDINHAKGGLSIVSVMLIAAVLLVVLIGYLMHQKLGWQRFQLPFTKKSNDLVLVNPKTEQPVANTSLLITRDGNKLQTTKKMAAVYINETGEIKLKINTGLMSIWQQNSLVKRLKDKKSQLRALLKSQQANPRYFFVEIPISMIKLQDQGIEIVIKPDPLLKKLACFKDCIPTLGFTQGENKGITKIAQTDYQQIFQKLILRWEVI